MMANWYHAVTKTTQKLTTCRKGSRRDSKCDGLWKVLSQSSRELRERRAKVLEATRRLYELRRCLGSFISGRTV